MAEIIFRNILKFFANLTILQLNSYSRGDISALSFDNEFPIYSSTLLELHLNVTSSNELLSLIDGRLSHLRSLYVEVQTFWRPSSNIDMKVIMTKMIFEILNNDLFLEENY